MDFITYLASTRVGGWVDMVVLGAAVGVCLGLIFALWRAWKAVRKRMKELKEQKRRGRLALLATVAAASIALSLSWYGMNLYFEEVMGFDDELARFALCGFIELMLIASALRSRDWRLLKASRLKEIDEKLKALPADDEGRAELLQEKADLEAMKRDVDGRAMWLFALLAGLMSALKVHDLVAVPPWLLAPLIATWGWERAMTAEALEITVAQATRLWVEDLKAMWERFCIKRGWKKPTSLNATEQAQEQQVNKIVDFAFQLRGMNEQLETAKQEAEALPEGKQRNKALRRVANLAEARLKVVTALHAATLTLMEMRLWTPAVEGEIFIRLDAMFNLENLADPKIVAERAKDSLAAVLAARSNNYDGSGTEAGNGPALDWRVDTTELEAFRDGEPNPDAPVSPAGPGPLTAHRSVDVQSLDERPAAPLSERSVSAAQSADERSPLTGQPLSERPGMSDQPLTAHRSVSAEPLGERSEVSATATETERSSERPAPIEVSADSNEPVEVGGIKVVPLTVKGVPDTVAAGWIAHQLAKGEQDFGPDVAALFGKGESTGRRWVSTVAARPELQKQEMELLAQLAG